VLSAERRREVPLLVRHLAATGDVDPLTSAEVPSLAEVPRDRGTALNSPALEGIAECRSRASSIGPHYLNRALAELLDHADDPAPLDENPERLAQAFLSRRGRSAVPWIFNTLANEIEYRLAIPAMGSVPPEMHLSLTGGCNIECRFCSYVHGEASFDPVTPPEVERLDFLRHVHTLRLSSGLGEPTVNPHLRSWTRSRGPIPIWP
jgi:hypothetical protein